MGKLTNYYDRAALSFTGFGASTALILQDVNVTDVTQSIKDVVGIMPPVLFKFIAIVVAIMIMVMILTITGIVPKMLNSIVGKLDKL